jgi:anti-sigma B factor antagonist
MRRKTLDAMSYDGLAVIADVANKRTDLSAIDVPPRRAALAVSEDVFGIDVCRVGERIVIYVHGELDLCTAPCLRMALVTACQGRGDVVVDLSNVSFLDASSLGLFATTATRLRVDHRRLLLRGMSAIQRRIVCLCELDQVLVIDSP